MKLVPMSKQNGHHSAIMAVIEGYLRVFEARLKDKVIGCKKIFGILIAN